MKKIFTLALSIIICSTLFAAGEFFVKINSNGNYTVSLNNQTITSQSNTFRFFDLYSGNFNLKVYENGFNGRTLFDQQVSVTDGYRTIAELDNFFAKKIGSETVTIGHESSVTDMSHTQLLNIGLQ
jgi:hypothetical protein